MDEMRTTHGQRQQAWQDEQTAKKIIISCVGGLIAIMYLLIPLLEGLTIG